MDKEKKYVEFFYEKFSGRISLGVGYNNDLTEIFPFVFEKDGTPLGIVAIGAISNGMELVNIYHIGAFRPKLGDGSFILKELCNQADRFNITLSVSAIFMPNGKDPVMESDKLTNWYKGFGFKGDDGLVREPAMI